MAAAWSSGARGFSSAGVSSLATASFTISGTDRYLEVLVYSGDSTPQNVTSVVWDAAGVNEALTQVESYITSRTYFRSSKWALVNPTAGTSKTVTVTWAGTQGETMVIADSYTGIDQTTPSRTRPTPSQTSTSTPSLSVTSVSGDLVVGAVAFSDDAGGVVSTITSSAVTVREKVEGADIGGYESCAQGDVTATGTSTSVGFTCNAVSQWYPVLYGVALIPSAGGGSPTTTIVSGSATAAVGIAETYTYTLDASPAGTVTVTPTAPVAGSWSPTTVGLTSGNWNTGLTSDFTASAAGSGNISSTNDGGLTNDTLAVTVYSTSRPSAVTAGSWTDEAGGSLVVADINDASDSTGAKDPAGASYPVLAFTADTPLTAASQTFYFRGRDITAGKRVRQVIYANDGTTVVATGAWHTMTGSLATYSDVLTPTATAYKGEIETQAAGGGAYALEFPSNISGTDTSAPFVALQFSNPQSDGLPIWGDANNGVTVVWKVKMAQQTGYYAMFWWSRGDGSFVGTDGYWGFHPYPSTGNTSGTTHYWEVASDGGDFLDYLGRGLGTATPKTVVKGTTFTQGIRVTRGGASSKTLKSYNELPSVANADVVEVTITTASYGETSPTTPKITIGDSPWYASYQHERFSGVLDSIKIFNNVLSEADMLDEAADFSQIVTAAGASSIWWGKNGFDTIDSLTCDFGTSRTFVWADTSNKGTLVARL